MLKYCLILLMAALLGGGCDRSDPAAAPPFFELPRPALIDYLSACGFEPALGGNDVQPGAYYIANTRFESAGVAYFDIGWRFAGGDPDDPASYALQEMVIGDMRRPDALTEARAVLDAWEAIFPPLTPLFVRLRQEATYTGNPGPQRYGDSDYVYGWAPNNKYYLRYDPRP